MPDIPTVRLNNGVDIPQLGFGVFQIEQKDTAEAVVTALEAGYRHIDTAQMYGNEVEVGQAIRQFGLDRDEVFVTTKLDNHRHGRDEARRATRREPGAARTRLRRPLPHPLAPPG